MATGTRRSRAELYDEAAAFTVYPVMKEGEPLDAQGNRSYRLIHEPNPEMRKIHGLIIDLLKTLPCDFQNAYGVQPGTSPQDNARQHLGNRYFYTLDIAHAYPSTPTDRLVEVLASLAAPMPREQVKTLIVDYCVGVSGGLATGGPASALLFDIYCSEVIDRVLREQVCTEPDTVYTRYIDDLTFSSPHPLPSIFRRRVRDVVESAGFLIHHRKSRVIDTCKEHAVVTGVQITADGEMLPSQESLTKAEHMLPDADGTPKCPHNVFRGIAEHLLSFSEPTPEEVRALQARYREVLAKLDTSKEVGVYGARFLYRLEEYDERFPTELLDEIRERVSLPDLIGPRVKLTRRGKEYVGLSPFQKEKTPSFTVVPEKQFFHCFSSGEHGDVITWVMKMEGLTFREAVIKLAKEAGVSLRIPEE